MNSIFGQICQYLKRWRTAYMGWRWTAAGMLKAKKEFRRFKSHKHLPVLKAALKTIATVNPPPRRLTTSPMPSKDLPAASAVAASTEFLMSPIPRKECIMVTFAKNYLKKLISYVPTEYWFRLSVHSTFQQEFSESLKVPTYDTKQELWDFAIKHFIDSKAPVTYVEFGVYRGDSIKYFASHNYGDKSIFVGLDSFEGLPEDWGTMLKGTFDTEGSIPDVNDSRIKFVKGWFQDSWDDAHSLIADKMENELFVHYDADLYSSTLFALTKIDSFHKTYYALFDEFFGHESRALYDYLKTYGAAVEFIAKTNNGGFPNQLLCRISPKVKC